MYGKSVGYFPSFWEFYFCSKWFGLCIHGHSYGVADSQQTELLVPAYIHYIIVMVNIISIPLPGLVMEHQQGTWLCCYRYKQSLYAVYVDAALQRTSVHDHIELIQLVGIPD